LVLAGAIPAALLALGADALLGLVEHWLRVPGAAKL
jgi:osmoprotectant transport system permease protein